MSKLRDEIRRIDADRAAIRAATEGVLGHARPRRKSWRVEEAERQQRDAAVLAQAEAEIAAMPAREAVGSALMTRGPARFLSIGQHVGTYGQHPDLGWVWEVRTPMRGAYQQPHKRSGSADSEADALARIRKAMAVHEAFLIRYSAHRYGS